MSKKILIAEDDEIIKRVLKAYFEKSNYEVYVASDGDEAIKIFNEVEINLIILDIMMPKINGYEVTKMIRSYSNVPIIFMTALSQETDILKGYSLKVDDYITKPFSPKVLVAKVNSLLQRIENAEEIQTDFVIGSLKINFSTMQVFLNSIELNMSRTEFKLLTFLIKNKDKTCSRELILDEIWGLDVYVDDRVIDTYIKILRKQLRPYDYIKTVFGIGYRFDIGEK